MGSQTVRELRAEFFGTFVLVAFGCGSVAQATLSHGELGSALSIHLSWGIAVALGLCLSGHVSGGHLNPAISFMLATRGRFPWGKVPVYCSAQLAGAFAAAGLVFVTYFEAFQAFDGGVRAVAGSNSTAGVFATYPAPHLSSLVGGLVDQTVGTALLAICVLGITDTRNESWSKPVAPLLVGLVVAVVGMAFGFNSGYAVNPARDFGPRFFTFCAGWGTEVFRAGGFWWWVPVVGPLLGAVVGGWAYDFFLPLKTGTGPRKKP